MGLIRNSAVLAVSVLLVFIAIFIFNPSGLYDGIVENLDYANFAIITSLYVATVYALAVRKKGGA